MRPNHVGALGGRTGQEPVNRTAAFASLITEMSQRYGVDESLIRAVIQQESAWDSSAYRLEPAKNDASAGLMQVLSKTAQWLLGDASITWGNLIDPRLNIEAGTKYLAYQLKRYGGDIQKTLAAYNAGSARYALNGDFINQGYVTSARGYYRQYAALAYEDDYAPVPSIPMVDADVPMSLDSTVADAATADVQDMPSEVEDAQDSFAQKDDPSAMALPFDPVLGLLALGGIVAIGGGGFAAWKRR